MDFKEWENKKDEAEDEKYVKMLFYTFLLSVAVVFVTTNGLLYLFLCWTTIPYDVATNFFCNDRSYTMTLSPFSHPYVVFSLTSLNLLVGAIYGVAHLCESVKNSLHKVI